MRPCAVVGGPPPLFIVLAADETADRAAAAAASRDGLASRALVNAARFETGGACAAGGGCGADAGCWTTDCCAVKNDKNAAGFRPARFFKLKK